MKVAILCFGLWILTAVSFALAMQMKGDFASAQARADACEAKALIADKVILTCLSQQTVVKWELKELASMIREMECK